MLATRKWFSLNAHGSHEGAFKLYEAHRKPRTSVVQAISSANTWMRDERGSDTSWLYGYDAWNANLDQPAAHPQMQAA